MKTFWEQQIFLIQHKKRFKRKAHSQHDEFLMEIIIF